MRRPCLSLPRHVSTMMRRVGVCTMKLWMLMCSLPFASAKCGYSQVIGLMASGVACGSRNLLPPVASISTILVTVTSPMVHFMPNAPVYRECSPDGPACANPPGSPESPPTKAGEEAHGAAHRLLRLPELALDPSGRSTD